MSNTNPGLSIYIDNVKDVTDDTDTDTAETRKINLEADIETAIANALSDHPDIKPGATVQADYIAGDEQ